jgi:hypothetical protein
LAKRREWLLSIPYAFENSVREFVDGHLVAVYGKDWWDDPKTVGKEIRRIVERNKAAEAKHRYHSRRTARPIYYTNLGDLGTLTIAKRDGRSSSVCSRVTNG